MYDCPICQQLLMEPTGLPGCPHTFCNVCISIFIQNSQYVKCPTCRKESHICDNLTPNILLSELIQEKIDVDVFAKRKSEYDYDKSLYNYIHEFEESDYFMELFMAMAKILMEEHIPFDMVCSKLQIQFPDRNIMIEIHILINKSAKLFVICDNYIVPTDRDAILIFMKKYISVINGSELLKLMNAIFKGIIEEVGITPKLSPLQIKIRDYITNHKNEIYEYFDQLNVKLTPLNKRKIQVSREQMSQFISEMVGHNH